MTRTPAPTRIPLVKAEHATTTPPPALQPQPLKTTTHAKQEPQEVPSTNNPPKETSGNLQQCQQPLFSNSVSELRNLNAALSTFLRRYDELRSHLDFIQTATEAESPQLLSAAPSPPQSSPIAPGNKTHSSATAETTIAKLGNSEETTGNDQPCESELESLCKSMDSRGLRKYIVSHLSNVGKLREEAPAALKLAPDPAKLVLESFGRFFLQPSKAYMIPARQVSVLILELFLMIGCNGNEIEAAVKDEAELTAVEWRNRLINESGVAKACEIDARGLLLFVGCFGIPSTFKNEDIRNLIQVSNPEEISDSLRRSSVLLARIPKILEEMMENKMQVKAVDIAYTFGLESRFPPHKFVQPFLRESKETWKIGRAAAHSYAAKNDANKMHLADLKSVLKCLEDHKIDPSSVGWRINDMISSLEREIADLDKKLGEKFTPKREADQSVSSKLTNREVKRTRVDGHGPQQQKVPGYANGKSRSDGLTPIKFLDGRIPGHISSFSASSYELHGAVEVVPEGSYAGVHGGKLVDSVGQVINDNGQQYGWHGDAAFGERLIGHRYPELFRPTPLPEEGFVGLSTPSSMGASNRRSGSDLYGFADTVL
ncbi:hypothetical protein U1Q18_042458 [Sarracenia purpurea var. burkii]